MPTKQKKKQNICKYKCPLCKRKFLSRKTLKNHLRVIHGKKGRNCKDESQAAYDIVEDRGRPNTKAGEKRKKAAAQKNIQKALAAKRAKQNLAKKPAKKSVPLFEENLELLEIKESKGKISSSETSAWQDFINFLNNEDETSEKTLLVNSELANAITDADRERLRPYSGKVKSLIESKKKFMRKKAEGKQTVEQANEALKEVRELEELLLAEIAAL